MNLQYFKENVFINSNTYCMVFARSCLFFSGEKYGFRVIKPVTVKINENLLVFLNHEPPSFKRNFATTGKSKYIYDNLLDHLRFDMRLEHEGAH